jgi:hypothetical protein
MPQSHAPGPDDGVDEWAAANAKFGGAARKARVRTALSLATFVAVFFGVVLGAGSALGEREQA